MSVDLYANTFLEGAVVFTLPSNATGAEYRIAVSAPSNTGASDRRYPLLIVLDGCMNFGTAVETVRLQAMTGTTMDLVVVGVSTAGSFAQHNLRRLRDYTPGGMRPDDPVWNASAIGKILLGRFAAARLPLEQAIGGAAAFQSFLSSELLPILLERYPIDPNDLGLLGHSVGGAFASHALLTGSPFHKLIMGSFGIEMYGETLAALEQVFVKRADRPARRVFSAVGGSELDDPQTRFSMGSGQEMLIRLQKAAPDSLDLVCQVFADETHGSLMAHLLASGVRLLWPSGKSYLESLPGRMGGKA